MDEHVISLAEVALEHTQRKWIEYLPLKRAFERPRTVAQVVSLGDEAALRGLCELHVTLSILEPLEQRSNLNVDDLRHVRDVQRVEEDHLVDAVEELRPEVLLQRVHD